MGNFDDVGITLVPETCQRVPEIKDFGYQFYNTTRTK